MRDTAETGGVSVRAYAGLTGVILAMNLTDMARRDGLLGFAIQREDLTFQRSGWLVGGLSFPGIEHQAGSPVSSQEAPIQRFRWSDYRVYPGATYRYTVQPVYGQPGRLELLPGPTVTVRTGSLGGQVVEGAPPVAHRVVFNRAVAASQAFAEHFAKLEQQMDEARRKGQPLPPLPPAAKTWLARDLLKQILWFIGRAVDASWALDIAIYEYELPEIIQAVQAASARGARVRVVYHAQPGDPQTEVNRQNLAGLPAEVQRGRQTRYICHHKFIVLSRVEDGPAPLRRPLAVLCGSTNFTENGLYRQANFIHMVEREETAAQYEALFELLFNGADTAATRKYINKSNLFAGQQNLYNGFSPRSGLVDLAGFVSCVEEAQRDVFFSTAFDLYNPLEDALLGQTHDMLLRYGLQNSSSRITGFHADRSADFVVAGLYSGGIEGWLKESTYGQKGNILIHTKLIIVDFTSASPLVISGSHNFSSSASRNNDENYLLVRGDADVADAYGCEFMRLYDHYRFRFHLKERRVEGAAAVPLQLKPDDTWTAPYFGGDPLKTTDRLAFAGAPL